MFRHARGAITALDLTIHLNTELTRPAGQLPEPPGAFGVSAGAVLE
jgi:hypothetical protein